MIYLFSERCRKSDKLLYVFHFFTIFFIVMPLLMVIYYSIFPAPDQEFKENLAMIDVNNLIVIFRSIWVAAVTIVVVFMLAYPFSYFLVNVKSFFWRVMLVSMVSSPLWSSYFVKLLGLRSFFDLMNGNLNSTRGITYVIIGLIYIYLPVAILNFYHALNNLPKNLINASLDLGNNDFESVFKVVLPYTKDSVLASVFLIFIPAFTTVTIADFLNYDQGSKVIGQIINNYVSSGSSSNIAKSRLSSLVLLVAFVVLSIYLLAKWLPFVSRRIVIGWRGFMNVDRRSG